MKKLNPGGSLGKSELLQNSSTKLKAKFVSVKVAQSCLTLCNPWAIQSMKFFRPKYWCR